VCVSNYVWFRDFQNEVSVTVAVSLTQNTFFSLHNASPLTGTSLHQHHTHPHPPANISKVVFTAFCIASYKVMYCIVCCNCNLMKVTVKFMILFYKYIF